jgi:hypothetical protein
MPERMCRARIMSCAVRGIGSHRLRGWPRRVFSWQLTVYSFGKEGNREIPTRRAAHGLGEIVNNAEDVSKGG